MLKYYHTNRLLWCIGLWGMEGGVHFSRGGTSTGAPAPLGCILSLLDSTSAAHFPPPSRLSEQTGPTRLWSRRMCIHLLPWELQNCKELLNNHGEDNVGSHWKKIPHVRGQRRSPNEMVGEAKSCLKSNLIPIRDTRRCKQNPGKGAMTPPQETEPDMPLSVWVSPVEEWVSSGLPWAQRLWQQQNWEVQYVA